jgi:kumamolisin
MRPPEYKVPLLGSERTPLPGFRILRRTNPSAMIDVTLLLRPRPDHKAYGKVEETPDHLRVERHYLTREEYAAANGTDPEDVRKIVEFATAHGLKPGDVNEAARTVPLRGTAAAISEAFGVDLFVYQRVGPRSTQRYRGRTGPIYIPAELDGIVQAVMGLDERPQATAL